MYDLSHHHQPFRFDVSRQTGSQHDTNMSMNENTNTGQYELTSERFRLLNRERISPSHGGSNVELARTVRGFESAPVWPSSERVAIAAPRKVVIAALKHATRKEIQNTHLPSLREISGGRRWLRSASLVCCGSYVARRGAARRSKAKRV
jgi:hypothetical protein